MTTVFDPVRFSVAENEFLLSSIGLPPVVAMKQVPRGVNPAAVRPVINRIYELVEQEKHSGLVWCGLDAVKQAITTFIEQSEKWEQDKRRGAPRFPSLFSFDSKNRPHFAGPGSDAGTVKTYFSKDGQRLPFAVELLPDGVQDWTPEWAAEGVAGTETPTKGLTVDAQRNLISCDICFHSESFNADKRGSFNAARARMSKHLRTAQTEQDEHRRIHTEEFGS